MWNRTGRNVPHGQGPVARKKSRNATQILRAVNPIPGQRGNPRKWGPGGKRSYGHEVPVGRVPRRRFGDFAAAGKVTRRPQAAKFPLRKEPSSGPMRASGPTKKRSIIAPSSVTASPCHLPPKGKAFKGSPLIRPLRGHLSLSPLSLRDIIPTPFGLRPFPPDRGNRPLDKGSRPPGGRLWRAFYPGL